MGRERYSPIAADCAYNDSDDGAAGSMSVASACEIYGVSHRNFLRWKWRATNAEGRVTACAEEYALFSQCAAAARACGYEPRSDWTGPCASIVEPDRRPAKEHPK